MENKHGKGGLIKVCSHYMQAVSMARFSIMWRFIDEPARRQVLELALTSQILYIMLACALIKIIEVREW